MIKIIGGISSSSDIFHSMLEFLLTYLTMDYEMKKILILDDEADILDLWFSKIKSWDLPIEIHSASNGVEALKLIEAVSKYDLIITDYKMPKMDGLEFIKTIRKNDKYKTVPIFFFTGYLPELSKYQSEFENVMLFEKPNVTDKMRTHLKMCLAI